MTLNKYLQAHIFVSNNYKNPVDGIFPLHSSKYWAEQSWVWENKKAEGAQPQTQTDFNTQHFQVLWATLASFAPIFLADENILYLLLPNLN